MNKKQMTVEKQTVLNSFKKETNVLIFNSYGSNLFYYLQAKHEMQTALDNSAFQCLILSVKFW